MDLADAHNLFAVRLYEWSKRDFLRELESGCPLLSLVGLNWRRVAALVAWNRSLSSQQRHELSGALTMLFHDNARRLKGEIATENVLSWKDVEYFQTTRIMHELPPLATSDRESPSFRPIDPERFLDRVASVSPVVLGGASRTRSAVRCVRRIGDWRLVTQFTFQRRLERMLDCTFQFIRKDDKARYPVPEDGRGPFPRNLFTFYGINNHTVVTAWSQEDTEPMALAMTKLAEHFVSQADPHFEGLGISD